MLTPAVCASQMCPCARERVSSARHGRCELREVTVTGMRSRTAARFEGSSSSDPVNVSLQMRMSVS